MTHDSDRETYYFQVFWITTIVLNSLFMSGLIVHLALPSNLFRARNKKKYKELDAIDDTQPVRRKTSKVIVAFRVSLLTCFILRLVYFILSFADRSFWLNEANEPLNRIFPDLISMTFFFTYMLLVVYWIVTYGRVKTKQIHGVKTELGVRYYVKVFSIVISTTLVLSCCMIALHLVTLYAIKRDDLEVYKWLILCCFFPLLTLVCAVAFIIVSYKSYTDLIMASQANNLHFQLNKIGHVARACMVYLFFKQVLSIVVIIPPVRDVFGDYESVIDFLYAVLVEIVPNIALLIALSIKDISSPLLVRDLGPLDATASPPAKQVHGSLFSEEESESESVKLYNDVTM